MKINQVKEVHTQSLTITILPFITPLLMELYKIYHYYLFILYFLIIIDAIIKVLMFVFKEHLLLFILLIHYR